MCYEEDAACQVDLNLVATASGQVIEVQAAAEGEPMTRAQHDALVDRAMHGIETLVPLQQAALARAGIDVARLLG